MSVNGSFLDKNGLTYLWSKLKTLFSNKQDVLTFDSTPTSGSINPVTSSGVYTDQDRQEIEIGVIANAGAKNLLKNTETSQTINGVTFTVNDDGSIMVNGTATGTAVFVINSSIKLFNGTILSGCPAEGSTSSHLLQIRTNTSAQNVVAYDAGASTIISSIDESVTYRCVILIANGYTANNLVFKPMIRRSAVTDSSFAPYAPTNAELYKMIQAMQEVHFGFKIDKSETSPNSAVIYTHDAITMSPAYMDFSADEFNYGSWRNAWFIKNSYPVALRFDGTEAYKLDPNDYTKRLDGTASDIQYILLDDEPSDWSTQWTQYYSLNGAEYVKNSSPTAPTFEADTYYKLTSLADDINFMVAFPKVYFKRYEDVSYNYVEVSNRKLNSDFKAYAHINRNGEEVDYIYLPLFKGSIVDGKLRSIPGEIPTGMTTATAELDAAQSLGIRWQFWDHSAREMICDLLTLISRNTDAQSAFGKGQESGYHASDTVTYGKLQTGTLLSKGQFFGYSSSTNEIKCFHMEGLWGNRWDRILGVLLINGVWNIKMTPNYNFTGSNFTALETPSPTTNNYLRTLSTSEYGSVPASVSANTNSPFNGYFYQSQSGTRVALVGGACSSGAVCGFRCISVGSAASHSTWNSGASPVYK